MADADLPEIAWRTRAEATIAASLDTLVARSADGVPIAPLYPRRSASSSRAWRSTPAWSVAQRLDHPDADAANALALVDLQGGADALTLVYAGSPFARGYGLAAEAALDRALGEIELDFISLRVDAGADTVAAARALVGLVERRTLTSAALAVDLGYDPLGLAARTGRPADADALTELLDLAAKAGLAGRPLLADGRPYHEAGAGEALELAAILATGVAALRKLETAGLGLDEARDALAVLVAVDADVFLGLAKVRATRRLWARVEAACGLEPKPLRLHAETSWRMMARRDPWTNVMRASAAVFAAGLGGADVVTVLPFTLPLGLPDEPARRLARNVQRVLIDEANLAMVDDPAAGAGGFEALTDGLCERSWALFQDIEREGGIEASLQAGALQGRIAAKAGARAGTIATLARGIVGTSRFPSLSAPTPNVLDVPPQSPTEGRPGALPHQRDAAPFEVLRDRADARASRGARPKVFLATLGAPAAFGARATYAANFFAAAGLETKTAVEERDVAGLAADFAASAASVACLCGTEKAYAASAAAAAAALRAEGARLILLAGRPAQAGAARPDGIDAFIHDGCDAPRVLAETLDAAACATDRLA